MLINEDFYIFDYSRVKKHIGKANHLHISLQCSDFSSLKSLAERIKAINNLSTTRDMIFPAIALVENTNAPTVLFENVKNFSNSVECMILENRLIKLGYEVFKQVMNAKDYNGYTGRARCYLFASKLGTGFTFPETEERSVHAWNDIISGNENELRDVTHTSSVAKGIIGGRLRPFTEKHDTAPVIFRAQSRQCKDALYCKIDDRYFMPSVKILKRLMGIPQNFIHSPFNAETVTETIGQSICYTMHGKLALSIKKHILDFVSGTTNKIKTIKAHNPVINIHTQGQLALF
jgi:DNA (cytosine-5)-methyltransferase 1